MAVCTLDASVPSTNVHREIVHMSKLSEITPHIRNIIANQQEQRKTLVKLVLTLLNKEEGPMTVDMWEKRKAEALFNAGLGPEPINMRLKRERDERKRLH